MHQEIERAQHLEAISKIEENNEKCRFGEFYAWPANPIYDLERIVKALSSNTYITSLYIARVILPEDIGISLGNVLKTNKTILNFTFSISENPGRMVMEAFASALSKNTSLLSFKLETLKLGDVEIEILHRGLSKNTTLVALNFGYNNIGTQGITELIKSITPNIALNSLSLYGNKLSQAGVDVIIDFLKTRNSLTYFDLSQTDLSIHNMERILHALSKNRSLVKLVLHEKDMKYTLINLPENFCSNHTNLTYCSLPIPSLQEVIDNTNFKIDTILKDLRNNTLNFDNLAAPYWNTLLEYNHIIRYDFFLHSRFKEYKSFYDDISYNYSKSAHLPQVLEFYCCAEELPLEIIKQILGAVACTDMVGKRCKKHPKY